MSHYLALVLVSKDARDVLGEAARLLAPYAQEGEDSVHDCYCRGLEARREARRRAEEVCSLTELRVRYGAALRQRLQDQKRRAQGDDARMRALAPLGTMDIAKTLYREIIAPYQALRVQVWAEHPKRDTVDPTCRACAGKGRFAVPRAAPKWDDWVVGGRWYGLLSGRRLDPLLRLVGDDVLATEENCVPGDRLSLHDWLPLAVVSPEGVWFQGGAVEDGWRAALRPRWRAEVEYLIARHRDALAIACDMAIWG
jgi:hypothetical protein